MDLNAEFTPHDDPSALNKLTAELGSRVLQVYLLKDVVF
jgi:hypothetical protein